MFSIVIVVIMMMMMIIIVIMMMIMIPRSECAVVSTVQQKSFMRLLSSQYVQVH